MMQTEEDVNFGKVMQVEGKEIERIRWNGEIEAEHWYYVMVCGICGIWLVALRARPPWQF